MIHPQPLQTWDLWYPGGGATGLPFARGQMDPTEVLWVHSAPKKLDVAVRNHDGSPVARGLVSRDGGYLPMTRLSLADGQLVREDRWPTDDDLGALVILPGGNRPPRPSEALDRFLQYAPRKPIARRTPTWTR